jgi:hypothetical protein
MKYDKLLKSSNIRAIKSANLRSAESLPSRKGLTLVPFQSRPKPKSRSAGPPEIDVKQDKSCHQQFLANASECLASSRLDVRPAATASVPKRLREILVLRTAHRRS